MNTRSHRNAYKYTWRFVCPPHRPDKVATVRRLSHTLNVPIILEEHQLAEIQDEWLHVALDKRDCAMQRFEYPVVVEDTSLEIDALHGAPGPYSKWLWRDGVTPEQFVRTLQRLEQPVRAVARCTLAYGYEDEICGMLWAEVEGTLVEPRGDHRTWGFNSIFQPCGLRATLSELSDEDYDLLSHRGRAWRDFLTQYPHAQSKSK